MTSIGAGSAADVEPCVALWAEVIAARDGDEVRDQVVERAREAFTRPAVRFAVVGDDPEGFALTTVRGPGVALLSRLCVHPRAGGRGLGAALVADAVLHARGAGLDRVELDVRATNERAAALYARAGFGVSSEPWTFDGGDPVVSWAVDL